MIVVVLNIRNANLDQSLLQDRNHRCSDLTLYMEASNRLIWFPSAIADVTHLRKALTEGEIDVEIIVVPCDSLARFLTDRGSSMSTAKTQVHEARAEDHPLIKMALRHDGSGPPLAKQAKRKL